MADFKKLSWMRDRLKTTPRVTTEDIDPGSGWINNPQSRFHQLLIDLPGFKKSDVKLQVDDTGTITISGGRRVGETRRVQFQKTFKAPEDSDTENISMIFAGDTLEVNIPKVAKTRKEEPDNKNGAQKGQLGEEKKEEFPSSKDVKEETEGKGQDVVSSSGLKEYQREEPESSIEAEKKKEESVIKNEVLSSDLREDKVERNESSEEAKEMKNKTEEFESSEEKKMDEEADTNGALSNKTREESERSMDAKEAEEKPEIKEVLSEKNEEHESRSRATKESKEDPEAKTGALSNDKREDVREEPDSGKVAKENKEEPSKIHEEKMKENAAKPKEQVKEQATSHDGKGKDNTRHEKTSEKSVMNRIVESRGLLLASLISFTLGVLVSQKFHKPPTK